MKIKAEILDQNNLTPRECDVLMLVCEGKADKVIAQQLAISAKTVSCHLDHLYQKLEIREASINARCAAISNSVARGIVRLSVNTLCLVLVVGALQIDNPSLRVGRTGYGRPSVSRSKSRRDA